MVGAARRPCKLSSRPSRRVFWRRSTRWLTARGASRGREVNRIQSRRRRFSYLPPIENQMARLTQRYA